jgi:hypothetical protein
MAPCTGTPDRQVVQERRPLARVGIMTVAATRCSPTSAVVVAVFAPERRGGTNEMAVSDTAVDTNRCAGRALQRERAAAMTMPTTEKTPVTTANPANGIVSPPSGTSKSMPTAWASAAARVLATIATSVAMKPVTTSLWGRWVLLFRPDVRPATPRCLSCCSCRSSPFDNWRTGVWMAGDDRVRGPGPPSHRSSCSRSRVTTSNASYHSPTTTATRAPASSASVHTATTACRLPAGTWAARAAGTGRRGT